MDVAALAPEVAKVIVMEAVVMLVAATAVEPMMEDVLVALAVVDHPVPVALVAPVVPGVALHVHRDVLVVVTVLAPVVDPIALVTVPVPMIMDRIQVVHMNTNPVEIMLMVIYPIHRVH